MNTPETKLQKTPTNFVCENCDFECSKMSDWNRHISTSKHLTIQNHTHPIQKHAKEYDCICGKSYGYSSNYYTHRKKCIVMIEKQNTTVDATPDNLSDSNLIVQLIKQNQEFKELLIEQNTKMVDTFSVAICDAIKQCSSSISNSTVNSHNKTFNLQVFLN